MKEKLFGIEKDMKNSPVYKILEYLREQYTHREFVTIEDLFQLIKEEAPEISEFFTLQHGLDLSLEDRQDKIDGEVDDVINGAGWATDEYVQNFILLSDDEKYEIMIKLAEKGLLFDEDKIGEDGDKRMSAKVSVDWVKKHYEPKPKTITQRDALRSLGEWRAESEGYTILKTPFEVLDALRGSISGEYEVDSKILKKEMKCCHRDVYEQACQMDQQP